MKLTRRRLLILGSVGALGASAVSDALTNDGGSGTLTAGDMALSQAFKLAESDRTIWLGPDSAKANLIATDGDFYMASDTDVDYVYDSGWQKQGVGSPSTKAGDSHFEALTAEKLNNGMRRYVSPDEDLSTVLSDEGAGWYVLEPNDAAGDADYELDDVPSDTHIRGADPKRVTVSTSDPQNTDLTISSGGSIGYVNLKTANAPSGSGLSSGDVRQIGVFWNKGGSSMGPAWWPRPLSIETGSSDAGDQDAPGISVRQQEKGDAYYAFNTNGDGYRSATDENSATRVFLGMREDVSENFFWVEEGNGAGRVIVEDSYRILDSGRTNRHVLKLGSNDDLQIGFEANDAAGSSAGLIQVYADDDVLFQKKDATKYFKLHSDKTFEQPPQDLTASGAPAPTDEGVYATHDGTGTPDAGLYRSDPGNNQWVKVEDNSTTISY